MMLAQVLNTSMLTLNNSDPVTPCQASSIGQIKRNGRHLLENYVVDKEFDGEIIGTPTYTPKRNVNRRVLHDL